VPSQPSGIFQELLGLSSGGNSYAEHMGMGRQVFALLAGASAWTFTKSVLAAIGVLLPVAAFGWFVSLARLGLDSRTRSSPCWQSEWWFSGS
jgi:hypothetical protein